MELQQLRYIVALSQERNFLRAAKRVHVTQPTLSHQIKKFEEEIGTPLFERSSHGVRLTSAGDKFIPFAMAAIDMLKTGLTELQDETKDISGKITIGVIPTINPYLMPGCLVKLKKEAPRLSLEIYEETTSILLDSLKAGTLDLGILALPITDTGIVHRSIGKEEFFLAVSRHHPLSKRKQVTSKIIKEEKLLILQEGHCFADQALEYCKRIREDDQIIFQGSSLTSVMKLASVGEGLTLVPRMAANAKENPDLVFIPFTSPKPSREIGIIWRVTAPLTPAHRLLIDIIVKAFD
ncbi:MAG: hydrogen peroxide-inducible genes activator [Candidatus Omnitrophica bacterium]|nr:hydrogen peroxide-inducible genes activator [Candidatus Omnitrophota bacterium]